MYKIISLFFCIILSLFCHLASGQFSFSSDGGYPRLKLSSSLGQLISGQGIGFGPVSSGFGQILGSLINNAGSSSSSPLTQLATAASTQYMNMVRSNPLFSQYTGQTQQAPSPMSYQQPYAAAHGPPQHVQQSMYNPMQGSMGLLGGDSSMYGPPPGAGYDSHFGGSSIFPQYAQPEHSKFAITINQ